MIVKQIYNTENKNQLLINLPDSFKKKKKILVVLDDSVDSKAEKLELMKMVLKDAQFLSDIEDVAKDFKTIDPEFQ